MADSVTIRRARLVLPQRVVTGDIVVEDGVIADITPRAVRTAGQTIDADGLVALPGLVDGHVRLDALESIEQAGSVLLAGGITSFVGLRQASNAAQLDVELDALAASSPVHFGLYVRADDGAAAALAATRARGVWLDADQLFDESVDKVFAEAPGLVVVRHHDAARSRDRWHLFDAPLAPVDLARVHDVDTCVRGTDRALQLAQRHGTRTHLLHLSTAEELQRLPLPERVTASVLPAHLFADTDVFADTDGWEGMGARGVHLPPLRAPRHRHAAWAALCKGQVSSASGHWPVGLANKEGPLATVHPGWPAAEWWLPLFLDAVNDGRCSLRDVAWATSEGPARALGLRRKGRLETGYDADIVLVDLDAIHTIGDDAPIQTAAGWSPWSGQTLRGWPVHTLLAGSTAWHRGHRGASRGRELSA